MNRRNVLSALACAPVGAVAAMLPDGETAKPGDDPQRQARCEAFAKLSEATHASLVACARLCGPESMQRLSEFTDAREALHIAQIELLKLL